MLSSTVVVKNAPGPYFGEYGGRWMPESLIAAMDELETTFNEAKNDPEFLAEFKRLSAEYSNRPSLLTEVPKFLGARRCPRLPQARGPEPHR